MIGLIGLTMAIAHFLPKFTKAIPGSLAAILTVTGLSFFLRSKGHTVYSVLDFVQNMDPTKITIQTSLPEFNIPAIPINWESIQIVLPYALLAAAVGLVESLMTLTLVDELTETRGRGNKESIGQGLANVLNGFFGGMGGCAMIGQSMINIRAGGRGRLSGITAALSLLFFIVFGAGFIEQIPLAALVGIMFMVVIATFEWSSIRIMKKIPKSDAFIIIAVSALTVIIDLAIAVFAGVIISALVFAWEQGKKITAIPWLSSKGEKIYNITGNLFFASATTFKDLFHIKDDPEHVYIDFTNARVFDHSGLEALQNITDRYKQHNKKLHLLNLSEECVSLLNKADNIVEISILKDTPYHLAEDKLA